MSGGGWVAEKFDRRAPSYDQSASHRWQARQAVKFLGPASGQRVLDVATGTGLAAREAVKRIGPEGSVIGTDISVGMLRAAREAMAGPTGWFVPADAAAAPFTGGMFDAVLCVAGVSYFPDLSAALAEWRRVCRPSARVVVTTPPPDGITTARVLRQAASSAGIELTNPGGPLSEPAGGHRCSPKPAGWSGGWTRWFSNRPAAIRPRHSGGSTRGSPSRCAPPRRRCGSGCGHASRRSIAPSRSSSIGFCWWS